MSKTKNVPDQRTNTLHIVGKPDESPADALASTALRPSIGAAITAKAFGAKYGDKLEIDALITALSDQAKAAQQGDLKRAEAMLMIQAHTLDAIFNELARRAALNMGEYLGAMETYLRIALKAQSQCRTTLETLAAIKNPAPVAFVHQANIAAGPQQVNNGVSEPARARETISTPNQLSDNANELRTDTGASQPAGRGDPQMETLGALDGAADASR